MFPFAYPFQDPLRSYAMDPEPETERKRPKKPAGFWKRTRKRVLLWMAPYLLQGFTSSWRMTVEDRSGTTGEGPRILIAWHENIGSLAQYGLSIRDRLTILVSSSRDGDAAVEQATRLRVRSVRGSSSKGGVAALRGLIRALEDKQWIGVLLDGPRGPARQAKPGVSMVAGLAQVPVIPVTAVCQSYWRVRSWDKTIIPKPFTKVRVVLGEPIPPPVSTSREDLEKHSKLLEEALNSLGELTY